MLPIPSLRLRMTTNVHLTGGLLWWLESFTCSNGLIGSSCCYLKVNISAEWVYLFWQRTYKQWERSRNGVTTNQMARMKQNANTPVTQLQYFHMHILQSCLSRATTVFIQCHTRGDRVPFFFFFDTGLNTPKTLLQDEKSELRITLDKNNNCYIFIQALPGEVVTY